MLKSSIIIIGSGIAGYSFAKEFRKIDKKTPVLMITEDNGDNYYKPNISTAMSKGKNINELVITDAIQMSKQLNMTIRTFTKVTNIDTEKQQVVLEKEILSYKKLVLAVGAKNIKPNIKNLHSINTYFINNLRQYSNFISALCHQERIAILGAGLIGCEYATDFQSSGYNVDVIAPNERVLERVLPVQVSNLIQSSLVEIGVNFHLSTNIISVTSTKQGQQINLSNGESLMYDKIVIAIGLAPRLLLAKKAGLRTNKGITVNRSLQTSDKNIYALGDCAEIDGDVMMYVLPILNSAKILAQTITGNQCELNTNVTPVTIKTTTCPTIYYMPQKPITGYWDVSQSRNGIKALYYCEKRKLRGFALTGEYTKHKAEMLIEIKNTLIPSRSD